MSNQGMDQEKRLRREIANSNERRRMQSINSGFQSLRSLLPQTDGEKLSKAAILQHAASLIQDLQQIEQERARFKRVLLSIKNGTPAAVAMQSLTEEELVETAPISYVPSVKKFRSNSATSTSSISSHAVSPGIVTSSAVSGTTPTPVTTPSAATPATAITATASTKTIKVEINNDSSNTSSSNNTTTTTTTTLSSSTGNRTKSNATNNTTNINNTRSTSGSSANTNNSNKNNIKGTNDIQTPGADNNQLQGTNADISHSTIATITDTNSESTPGKAAIALPLDVSFISDNVIVIEQGEKTVSPSHSQQAASRQNLDSIFEAIKHLEGEGLFKA